MLHHLDAVAAHAYYTGDLAAGRRACERILAMPDLPPAIETRTRTNRTWYTQPLADLVGTRFVRLHDDAVRPGGDAEWSSFNPSIVSAEWRGQPRGWIVNVRSSNYRIEAGRYVMPEAHDNMILTTNYLVRLSDDLDVLASSQLKAVYPGTPFPVHGLEDVRLNVVGGELLASATVRDYLPFDGTCRIATAFVDEQEQCFTAIRCRETADGVHEKNWMPIVGRRAWLYSCSINGHVATVMADDDRWEVTAGAPSPPLASKFRGGSQLVPTADGGSSWLAIVHEVADSGNGMRVYEHRFVLFDESAGWRISKVSPAFVFREPRSIEFAAGLARQGSRIVASFGIRDREAWLVEMELPEVLRLLEPVA